MQAKPCQTIVFHGERCLSRSTTGTNNCCEVHSEFSRLARSGCHTEQLATATHSSFEYPDFLHILQGEEEARCLFTATERLDASYGSVLQTVSVFQRPQGSSAADEVLTDRA